MERHKVWTLVLVLFVGCSDQAAIPPETDGGIDSSPLEDGLVIQDGILPGDQGTDGLVPRDGPPLPPDLDRDGGKLCGPFPGGGCGKGAVCDIHGCLPGSSGVCVPQPTNCTYLWDPVCGCDGKTYSSDCFRLLAGAALDHTGECSPTLVDGGPVLDWPIPPTDGSIVPAKCGPFPGGQCPSSMTCDIHYCALGATGVCVPTPFGCPKIWAPVCGCNDQTYGNDCLRLLTGVARKHVGACVSTPVDAGITDATKICGYFPGGGCGPGSVCDIYGCSITDTGTCVLKPINCPYLWAPVCGCNAQTYANDCIRLMAGVALNHKGACSDGGTP